MILFINLVFTSLFMELPFIIEQLRDMYQGDPWFGRNAKALLSEVDESIAFEKPNDQHSIVELVWHMNNWHEFALSRIRKDYEQDVFYYEENDWRYLDHNDNSLWKSALSRFHEIHTELLKTIRELSEEILDKEVEGRRYTYRKLLHGILQHDIYHLGQIAFLVKLIKQKKAD